MCQKVKCNTFPLLERHSNLFNSTKGCKKNNYSDFCQNVGFIKKSITILQKRIKRYRCIIYEIHILIQCVELCDVQSEIYYHHKAKVTCNKTFEYICITYVCS